MFGNRYLSQKFPGIIAEFCSSGSLDYYLAYNAISVDLTKSLIQGIARGMLHLVKVKKVLGNFREISPRKELSTEI